MITQERVKELLSYDPETGDFVWRVNRTGTARAGTVAGALNSDGYRQIAIDGPKYFAHRLVWFYLYGRFPSNQIDHKNCNPSDNRLCNLREATASDNKANRRISKNNTSGIKGVCWDHRSGGHWRAQIKHKGRSIHLGTFRDIEKAKEAYDKASQEIFGDFARAV